MKGSRKVIQLTEAISKQQIIKNLQDESFDAETLIQNIEELGAPSFELAYKAPLNDLSWIYVLKFLSLKKKENDQNISKEEAHALYEISFIIKNKVAVDEKIKEFILSFLKTKSYREWFLKYSDYKPEIAQAIKDFLVKKTISPIFVGDGYKIYEVNTYSEIRTIAPPPDTNWCVSSSNGEAYMEQYKDAGLKMYALIFDNGEKFLLTVPGPEIIEDIKEYYMKTRNEEEFFRKFLNTLKEEDEDILIKIVKRRFPILQEIEKNPEEFSKIKEEYYNNLELAVQEAFNTLYDTIDESVKKFIEKFKKDMSSYDMVNIIYNPVIKKYQNNQITSSIVKHFLELSNTIKKIVNMNNLLNIGKLKYTQFDAYIFQNYTIDYDFLVKVFDAQKYSKTSDVAGINIFEFANKNDNHFSPEDYMPYYMNGPYIAKIHPYIEEYFYDTGGAITFERFFYNYFNKILEIFLDTNDGNIIDNIMLEYTENEINEILRKVNIDELKDFITSRSKMHYILFTSSEFEIRQFITENIDFQKNLFKENRAILYDKRMHEVMQKNVHLLEKNKEEFESFYVFTPSPDDFAYYSSYAYFVLLYHAYMELAKISDSKKITDRLAYTEDIVNKYKEIFK